jgi:hypothetical protein
MTQNNRNDTSLFKFFCFGATFDLLSLLSIVEPNWNAKGMFETCSAHSLSVIVSVLGEVGEGTETKKPNDNSKMPTGPLSLIQVRPCIIERHPRQTDFKSWRPRA